jgi:hypothetical protein
VRDQAGERNPWESKSLAQFLMTKTAGGGETDQWLENKNREPDLVREPRSRRVLTARPPNLTTK